MKIIVLFGLLVTLGTGVFFLSDEYKRWIVLNGSDAEQYALDLLSGSTMQTPPKFIDYSISTSDGFVTFSKHNDHSTIYGYFPTKTPQETEKMVSELDWEPLSGKWYVSQP